MIMEAMHDIVFGATYIIFVSEFNKIVKSEGWFAALHMRKWYTLRPTLMTC